MGKVCKKFSETSKPIQSKCCIDRPLVNFYKSYEFLGGNRMFKMAASSGHS